MRIFKGLSSVQPSEERKYFEFSTMILVDRFFKWHFVNVNIYIACVKVAKSIYYVPHVSKN